MNLFCETKLFSGVNEDRETLIFPVQLTTIRIDNHNTRLIHTLLKVLTLCYYDWGVCLNPMNSFVLAASVPILNVLIIFLLTGWVDTQNKRFGCVESFLLKLDRTDE